MSRFRRVIHSIGSSYVVLGANMIYTLMSVPLALRYLSGEEFGLWALVMQLGGYLALLDLGLSASAGRILFEVKDDQSGQVYGETLQTGFLVLALQGLLLVVLGVLAAPALATVLKVPAHLQHDFVILLRWQCLIGGISLGGRMLSNVLVVHHRWDIANYIQCLVFVVSFVTLWLSFAAGWKLYSLPVTTAIGSLVAIAGWIVAASRLRLYPKRGTWGRPRTSRFLQMLVLGRDMFLVNVGFQFVMASQTLIVTRVLGLEGAAIWSVCTKMFALALQLVWRLYDFSSTAFAEMFVRKEEEQLQRRFKGIVTVTASLAALAGVLFAVFNQPFVALWAGPQLAWDNINNVLLGVWLILVSVARCHTGHILVTARIGGLRYIYLAEAAAFLILGEWLARHWGFPGIMVAAIVSTSLLSGAYGIWRSRETFGVPLRELLLQWQMPMLRVVICVVPVAAAIWFGLGRASDIGRMAAALFVAALGALVLLRAGLPTEMQSELLRRAPAPAAAFLQKVFPHRSAAPRYQ